MLLLLWGHAVPMMRENEECLPAKLNSPWNILTPSPTIRPSVSDSIRSGQLLRRFRHRIRLTWPGFRRPRGGEQRQTAPLSPPILQWRFSERSLQETELPEEATIPRAILRDGNPGLIRSLLWTGSPIMRGTPADSVGRILLTDLNWGRGYPIRSVWTIPSVLISTGFLIKFHYTRVRSRLTERRQRRGEIRTVMRSNSILAIICVTSAERALLHC